MKKISSVLSGRFYGAMRGLARRTEVLAALIRDELQNNGIPPQCGVASCDNGVLCLQADSAAVAFRIRQILPTLRRILNNAGYKITLIKVLSPPAIKRRRFVL